MIIKSKCVCVLLQFFFDLTDFYPESLEAPVEVAPGYMEKIAEGSGVTSALPEMVDEIILLELKNEIGKWLPGKKRFREHEFRNACAVAGGKMEMSSALDGESLHDVAELPYVSSP